MVGIETYIQELKNSGYTNPDYFAYQKLWYRDGKPTIYYPNGATQDEGGGWDAVNKYWDYYTTASERIRNLAEIQKAEQGLIAEQQQLQAKLNMLSSPTAQWVNETTFLNEQEKIYNLLSGVPVVEPPSSIITPINPTIKPPIMITQTEQSNPVFEQLDKIRAKLQENAGLQKTSVFDNPILMIAIVGIVLFLILRR